jgi:hypothetical protein
MPPRRLRAPAEDGAILARPTLEEIGPELAASETAFSARHFRFLGMAWPEVRSQARHAVLAAASRYMAAAAEPTPPWRSSDRLFMAGHQPELFHPGVWIKNYALCGLAQNYGGVAVNLLVDNDTVKSCSLRIPQAAETDSAMAKGRLVDFDMWTQERPYEEWIIKDRQLFASFADRVEPLTQSWGFKPMLRQFWAEVTRQQSRTPFLGECFAAARRIKERSWGCHNLEVPLSALCRSEPFSWFFCHLLAELPRFHWIHNDCLANYRRQYRLRSRSHPVPDLARQDEWLETPFWGWHIKEPQRSRVFGRADGNAMDLRLNANGKVFARLRPTDDWRQSAELIRDLEGRGIKIRTRALTTTLFARLFLADYFVHGIGGGKYDELNDAIVRRFYELEPPPFMILSGTLRLPFHRHAATPGQIRDLAHQVRDIRCNPQRYLGRKPELDSQTRTLVQEKENWIGRELNDSAERRRRYQRLQSLTAALQPAIADQAQCLSDRLAQLERQLQSNAVLDRRDYAFCLYPESLLRPFCAQFLARSGP